MNKIIAIVNHKGGVGKTTTTLNLGKALSLQGKKVLLIDIDPQANLSQSVGIEEPVQSIYESLCGEQSLPMYELATNFYLCPAELDLSEAELKLQADVNGYFRLKKLIKDLKFDFILIDCPPSLGILTLNALVAASGVMIVVQSEYLAVKGLETIMRLTDRLKENLNPNIKITGLLLTQLNHTVFRKNIAQTVRGIYEGYVFENSIRQNISLAEASSQGKTVFDYANDSHGAEDYRNLALEFLKKQ